MAKTQPPRLVRILRVHAVGLGLETGSLVGLDVVGTPVLRERHVIQRAGKQPSPLAERFRRFRVEEGADLIRQIGLP